MLSVIEQCCRTCIDAVPNHDRTALRCVGFNRLVSEHDACEAWLLNEVIVGGKADHRDVVVVAIDAGDTARAA